MGLAVKKRSAAMKWLANQQAYFYGGKIQKLIAQYDQCFNLGGYFVKTYMELEPFI